MQLEAEEPADAGFAASGQAGKHPVAVDPTRGTHRQWRTVDVVDARPSSHPGEQKDRQGHPDMGGQGNEARIKGGFWEGQAEQGENDALVECLEIAEVRAVIQHQDGHDLAVSEPCLWSALLDRLCLFAQQPSLPMWAKRLAKIIELAEIFHEPVEHQCLRTSNGADSRRRMQRQQGLKAHLKPVTRVTLVS